MTHRDDISMTARSATTGQVSDGRMVTRFAPSPTGRLHLGHAVSAIRAHDFARALVTADDLDGWLFRFRCYACFD
jgi:hypothetical protein